MSPRGGAPAEIAVDSIKPVCRFHLVGGELWLYVTVSFDDLNPVSLALHVNVADGLSRFAEEARASVIECLDNDQMLEGEVAFAVLDPRMVGFPV